MNIKRKQHTDSFKAKVALEAIRETMTMAEISHKYKVHSTQIHHWKKQVLNLLPELFSRSADHALKEKENEIEELYKSIGQLKVELDWLKKKSGIEY